MSLHTKSRFQRASPKNAADSEPYPVSLPGFGMSVDLGDRPLSASPQRRRPVKGHIWRASIRVNTQIDILLRKFDGPGASARNCMKNSPFDRAR
jgi:hypothetical protein